MIITFVGQFNYIAANKLAALAWKMTWHWTGLLLKLYFTLFIWQFRLFSVCIGVICINTIVISIATASTCATANGESVQMWKCEDWAVFCSDYRVICLVFPLLAQYPSGLCISRVENEHSWCKQSRHHWQTHSWFDRQISTSEAGETDCNMIHLKIKYNGYILWTLQIVKPSEENTVLWFLKKINLTWFESSWFVKLAEHAFSRIEAGLPSGSASLYSSPDNSLPIRGNE